MTDSTDALVADRGQIHGQWSHQSDICQHMKQYAMGQPGYEKLSRSQRDGLDMILVKISRILAGDPNHKDHWDDIAGYARLVARELEPPTLPIARGVASIHHPV